MDAIRAQSAPDVRGPGEDEGVGSLDVRPQEVPGRPNKIIRFIDADMAHPDDAPAGFDERSGQPGRLRIVQHHDVTWPREIQHARELASKGSAIDTTFLGPERAPIPR